MLIKPLPDDLGFVVGDRHSAAAVAFILNPSVETPLIMGLAQLVSSPAHCFSRQPCFMSIEATLHLRSLLWTSWGNSRYKLLIIKNVHPSIWVFVQNTANVRRSKGSWEHACICNTCELQPWTSRHYSEEAYVRKQTCESVGPDVKQTCQPANTIEETVCVMTN